MFQSPPCGLCYRSFVIMFSGRATLPVGNRKETASLVSKLGVLLRALKNLWIDRKYAAKCFEAFSVATDVVVLLGRTVSVETVFSGSFINVVNLQLHNKHENLKGSLKRLNASIINHTRLLQGPDLQVGQFKILRWCVWKKSMSHHQVDHSHSIGHIKLQY